METREALLCVVVKNTYEYLQSIILISPYACELINDNSKEIKAEVSFKNNELNSPIQS